MRIYERTRDKVFAISAVATLMIGDASNSGGTKEESNNSKGSYAVTQNEKQGKNIESKRLEGGRTLR